MEPTPEFAHLHGSIDHDLREAVTISKGWLQAALKNWKTLDENDRESMVAAALFGANRIAFLLDLMDGKSEDEVIPPSERTAEDFLGISESAI